MLFSTRFVGSRNSNRVREMTFSMDATIFAASLTSVFLSFPALKRSTTGRSAKSESCASPTACDLISRNR